MAIVQAHLESYSEGFLDWGFDPKNINLAAHYKKEIPLEKLKAIKEESYRAVWWPNAVCTREPTAQNFFRRAAIKNIAGLTSAAYGDVTLALKMEPNNFEYVKLALKLSAMTGRITSGRILADKWADKIINCRDTELQNSIAFLAAVR